jgi:hypothetical protein
MIPLMPRRCPNADGLCELTKTVFLRSNGIDDFQLGDQPRSQ